MSEEKKGWYVLRAISGKENKVKEVLDAEIKNTDLGNYVFQVLIPTEKVYTVRNGKKVVKEKNLYSGYVFVEAILVGEVVHHLRNTTNVIDFLGENPISRSLYGLRKLIVCWAQSTRCRRWVTNRPLYIMSVKR